MKPALILAGLAIAIAGAVSRAGAETKPEGPHEPRCTDDSLRSLKADPAALASALSKLYRANSDDGEELVPTELVTQLKMCTDPLCVAYRAYFLFPADAAAARALIACIEDAREVIERGIEIFPEVAVPPLADFTRDQMGQLIVALHKQAEYTAPIPRRLLYDRAVLSPLAGLGRYPPAIEEEPESYRQNGADAIDRLAQHLSLMESGRWARTSYEPYPGSIEIDIGAGHRNLRWFMLYAPSLLLESEPEATRCVAEACVEPLRVWAHRGVWNMAKYDELRRLIGEASGGLRRFYEASSRLRRYAPDAEKIVLRYVFARDSVIETRSTVIAGSLAYKMFGSDTLRELGDLQREWAKAPKDSGGIAERRRDLAEGLKLAALHNYPDEVLSWLLDQGAPIDDGPEGALVYGIRSPRVIRFLLAHGADPNRPNGFGKTPLYYAVQLGSEESVKILLDAGADPNRKLLEEAELVAMSKASLTSPAAYETYLMEVTAGFTPLLYSLRYASPQVTSLLVGRGARVQLPVERYLDWINGEPGRNWTAESVVAATAHTQM